jgi:capsular exopolysaccharide synthesis family protein
MEFRQYVSSFLKWWWLIVITVAVAAGSSYYATKAMPRTYQSRTTLMVGQVMQNPNPDSNEFYTGQVLAQSYADLARREPVLQGALKSLELPWPWDNLAGMVTARIIPGTQLLEIAVLDSDPQRAQALAAEVANQLILQSPAATDPEKEAERQFALTQIADLKAKLKKAQDEIRQLDDVVAKASSARQIQDANSRQAALENQVSTWQYTYAQLLTTLQKGTPNSLSIVEPAQLPTSPVGPNTFNNVLLAAAIGLVLAVGTALLLEYLDDTLKTPEDVDKALGLATLGSIARIDGRNYADRLIVLHKPGSHVAEAYRVLRTNLEYSAVDRPLRTLVVTSSEPMEGKSITSANLAVAIAQSGRRVILIDADLRRPVQHRTFNLTASTGLTTLLLGTAGSSLGDLGDALHEVGIENLRVIPAGPLPPNPAELLGSRRLADVLQGLQAEADIVILDSPPVMAVADATILASRVDGVLLLAESGGTRRSVAQRARDALKKVNAPLLGVVLNRVPSRRGGRYGYYYYDDSGRRKRDSSRSGLARVFGRNGDRTGDHTGNSAPAHEPIAPTK